MLRSCLLAKRILCLLWEVLNSLLRDLDTFTFVFTGNFISSHLSSKIKFPFELHIHNLKEHLNFFKRLFSFKSVVKVHISLLKEHLKFTYATSNVLKYMMTLVRLVNRDTEITSSSSL